MLDYDDFVSRNLYNKQHIALAKIPKEIMNLPCYFVQMRAYSILGLNNIRAFFQTDSCQMSQQVLTSLKIHELKNVIDDLY